MKIAYYTEINLNDSDGPAINELEFINSLSSLDPADYQIFLTDLNKNLVFANRPNIIFLDATPRISQLFKWVSRYRFINRKMQMQGADLLICRVTDFPFVLLFLKIFNPNVKIAIKTAAIWWAGRTKEAKISFKDHIYNVLNDLITKFVYKKSDAIDVAMSETIAELIKLRLIDAEKTCLIDNATNIQTFFPLSSLEAKLALGIPENAIVLGFAGSMPSYRGAKQILKVAEKLDSTVNNIFILIVGHDSFLEDLIANSNIARHKIINAGKIPYTEVNKYIAAMTIGYSFWEPLQIKQTGNASQKVKQYIAMGKPVISVAIGHQYLQDYDLGSPVDQENIDEIIFETKKWIDRIQIESDSLAERLHAHAKDHLSTEKTFNERLNFWKKILKMDMVKAFEVS